MATPHRRISPSLWASKKPFGIGEQRPNNYLEVTRAAWENRDRLRYAWRILDHGVCDGCSLGTAGMSDWTLDDIHLCNIRLRLLRLNTQPALPMAVMADAAALRRMPGKELRGLGRLPHPMVRRRGEPGFTRVTWDRALDLIAERIGTSAPDRLGFYLTSRGMPNENYYGVQKAVRALGTNSVDNAARVCHSPSTFGLKEGLGVGATTCSYTDWIGSDLVVFIGSNPANNQPVAMKYLHRARKAGTKVAMVNPYREPGMERYWVPSNVESALFGTRITDRFFQVSVGGDVAFLNGALKHMIDRGLGRPRLHRPPHHRIRRRRRCRRRPDVGGPGGRRRSRSERDGGVRRDAARGEDGGPGLVDGGDPARHSARTGSAPSSTSGCPRGSSVAPSAV